MTVDNVQAKETPCVLNTYSVKTDLGIFSIYLGFLNLFTVLLRGSFPCLLERHLHMILPSYGIYMLEKGVEPSLLKSNIFLP